MPPTESPEILRLFPAPARRVAGAAGAYGDLRPPSGPERSRPYVMINMVSSLDGRAAVGGKAGGIGGPADREAMRVLRSKADAVMIGAGTLRSEKVSLTSEGRRTPEPLAIIVTQSANVPLEENLLHATASRTVILLPENRSARLAGRFSGRAQVLGAPAGSTGGGVDLVRALRLIRERLGVATLLVEGGPRLNHALISENLADELFLTLSPKLIGGGEQSATTIVQGDGPWETSKPARLLSAHLCGSELFLRYSMTP